MNLVLTFTSAWGAYLWYDPLVGGLITRADHSSSLRERSLKSMDQAGAAISKKQQTSYK